MRASFVHGWVVLFTFYSFDRWAAVCSFSRLLFVPSVGCLSLQSAAFYSFSRLFVASVGCLLFLQSAVCRFSRLPFIPSVGFLSLQSAAVCPFGRHLCFRSAFRLTLAERGGSPVEDRIPDTQPLRVSPRSCGVGSGFYADCCASGRGIFRSGSLGDRSPECLSDAR